MFEMVHGSAANTEVMESLSDCKPQGRDACGQ